MRFTCVLAAIYLATVTCATAQISFTYPIPSGHIQVEHQLATYLLQVGYPEIQAEFHGTQLTVRSHAALDAADIVVLAYRLSAYYALDPQMSDLARIHILSDYQGTSNDVLKYKHGLVLDPDLLELIRSNPDTIAVISALPRNIRPLVQPDEYEDGDNDRSGATTSFHELHTLHDNDVDWFAYTATLGGQYVIETAAVLGRPRVDTTLDVSVGDQVYADDDGGTNLYSMIDVVMDAGSVLTIKVSAYGFDTGYYTLKITRVSVPRNLLSDSGTTGGLLGTGRLLESVRRILGTIF